MKINKLLLAMIAVSLVYTSGCKKKTVYISDIVQKHFYYKAGSYWVYRDTISGRYDSFSVENIASKIDDRTYDYPEQNLIINILDRTNPNIKLEEVMQNYSMISLAFTFNNQLTIATDFSYPFSYSSNFTKKIYSNYSFNNAIYTNVTELHEGDNYWYISDSAGIIEFYTDSLAWQLQRVKIVI